MEDCTEKTIPGCGRILVCRSTPITRVIPREALARLRYLSPGKITTGIDMDGDKAYYAYPSLTGGGFYVEASLTGLAAGGCGPLMRGELIPLVEEAFHDDPHLTQVIMIITEKMLR